MYGTPFMYSTPDIFTSKEFSFLNLDHFETCIKATKNLEYDEFDLANSYKPQNLQNSNLLKKRVHAQFGST